MNVVVEEADETVFWLEFIVDIRILAAEKLTLLIKEGKRAAGDLCRLASNG